MKEMWRIAYKYEDMPKYRLMKGEYETKAAAEASAAQLISSKPFETVVLQWPPKN